MILLAFYHCLIPSYFQLGSHTATSPRASSPSSSEAGTDDLDGPTDLGQVQAIDRMTARQRSKHDASYVEQLMVLPEGSYILP